METVALIAKLRNEVEETASSKNGRTPFDAFYAAHENARLDFPEASNSNSDFCESILGSLQGLLCESEPETVCAWFKARGVKY